MLTEISASSDVTEQADWLELKALAAHDRSSSLQDLVSELRGNGSTDAVNDSVDALVDRGSETSQQLAEAAFDELEERSRAAGSGYPFAVDDQSVELDWTAPAIESTYVFLLLLSWYGQRAVRIDNMRPERVFEQISHTAASGFFGRNCHDGNYRIGFPRADGSNFRDAVDQLTHSIGEGVGASQNCDPQIDKDADLDVVVWHGFRDPWPGRLVAFGQCTTSRAWHAKLSDLSDTRAWCDTWMIKTLIVPPVRMFFIPHRLTRREWAVEAPKGGIVFERCRIAYHSPTIPSDVCPAVRTWSQEVIDARVRPWALGFESPVVAEYGIR